MKTEQVILKILESLDEKLDDKKPDFSDINPENLGISQVRWSYILEMMQESRLIKGVNFSKGGNTRSALMTHVDNMQITLSGIHYLADNTATAKVIKAAKLLKDTIPGL